MNQLSLKNIISKKNGVDVLLQSLLEQMDACIKITDKNDQFFMGDPAATDACVYPIKLKDECIGSVRGDEKGKNIANIINLLAQKEIERRNLGSEVLTLYQEVNMVFNFSDKLAQAIDPVSIAKITVEQAMNLINALSGIVVLWDVSGETLQIPAASGEELFNKKNLSEHANILLEIGMNGQSDILSDLTDLKNSGIVLPAVESIVYAALKVQHRVMGAIILAGDKPLQFAAADLKFLTTLALQSSSAIESALLYEKNIREALEREEAIRRVYEVAAKFVPYEFIGSLGYSVITEVKLGDLVQKTVTVLFTDIRDYTSLSEQMTPEENFRFVNVYNKRMGPIIREHNGFINQYLGDAIMALFPGKAEQTLAAAIEMHRNIRQFNDEQNQKKQPGIKMGIGMHTGPLIMGITGDKDRLDATTISDTVNTASRIESLTKYYKANILLSEDTVNQIENQELFNIRYLGKVRVKGKQASIGLYECYSGDSEEIIFKKDHTFSTFNEGMSHYMNQSFSKAIAAFESVLEINREDQMAALFLNNSIRFLKNGVPENWSGVLEMHDK